VHWATAFILAQQFYINLSTTYITTMKLFCETRDVTRPIEVMGLGEIGHVIAWRICRRTRSLHTLPHSLPGPDYLDEEAKRYSRLFEFYQVTFCRGVALVPGMDQIPIPTTSAHVPSACVNNRICWALFESSSSLSCTISAVESQRSGEFCILICYFEVS